VTRPDTRNGPRAVTPGGRTTSSPPGVEADSTVTAGTGRGRDPGADLAVTRRAAWLRLSAERDMWLRRVLAAWREGYQAALDDAVVSSLLRAWPAPGHVPDIEKRRWGPGGRGRFADPRPGDYPGRRHG